LVSKMLQKAGKSCIECTISSTRTSFLTFLSSKCPELATQITTYIGPTLHVVDLFDFVVVGAFETSQTFTFQPHPLEARSSDRVWVKDEGLRCFIKDVFGSCL
jgi:hypothetical protein